MEKKNTLKENIQWLVEQYKKELQLEEQKDILKQNLDLVDAYKNIIIELEYALELDK